MQKRDNIPYILPTMPFGTFGPPQIETDPFGCYTGVPRELGEVPIQDADDL